MLLNEKETLKKLLALVTHGERTREAKIARLLSESKGSEGGQEAGSVQRQKSEDGAAAGVETSEREKRTGHRVRRQLHTPRIQGSIYKDGEGGSAGLTA